MLSAKRGDILVEDPILVYPSLYSLGLMEQIIRTRGVIDESRFFPLIGKKSYFTSIIPRFRQVLQDMWEDGTIHRIMAAYQE